MAKYVVVKTKAGWVVQNSSTYVIAGGCYTNEDQAKALAIKLNK